MAPNIKIILLLLIPTTICVAQERLLKTIQLPYKVRNAYVDRPGDLYIEQQSGTIQKFDIHGKLIDQFILNQPLDLFDPRDGARAFSFNKKQNWYSYAYFGNLNKTILKPEFAIQPALVCSSGDKNIWLFDEADYSLKKINTSNSSVVVEVALPEELRSIQAQNLTMREYQNFLFLLDHQTGIYIFNSIGIFVNSLKGKNISYFNFLGEELYYPQKDRLIFYDLFDTKIRELEISPGVVFMLLTDQRIYSIFTNRIEIVGSNP